MVWRQVIGVWLTVLAVIWLATVGAPSPKPVVMAGKGGIRGVDFTSDFDGDGFADLAVGVLQDDVGDIRGAGTVSVLYGSAAGASDRNQLWSQDSPGIEDSAEEFDGFGWAVAIGDFNGDGYADLAIGVPGEEVMSVANAGAVNVLYGSSQGLSAAGNQYWDQASPGVAEEPEFLDSLGSALAAGDFNGDGFADLAIGVPGESNWEFSAHGGVNVLYGSPGGLTALKSQYWDQASPGIKDELEAGDEFGSALSAADYNADGFVDLAVSVVGENGVAGAVHVLYGSSGGVSAVGSQFWSQDSPGIKDVAESGDGFGAHLASGDFNGDGYPDLAVGVSGEDVVQVGGDEGAVNVLYGSPVGLTAKGNQFWHQDSPGIKDRAELADAFGLSLSAADYNGDGFVDLAIGVPGESFDRPVGTVRQAGAVNILYGTPAGLAATGNQFWHEGSAGIKGRVEFFDLFGWALGSEDFDGDGFMDLVVGVPNKETRLYQAGALYVIYGTGSGLTSERSQFWHRGSPGIKGRVQESAWFAWSLSGR